MEMSTIINYGFYAFLAIYVLFGAIIGCIRGFRRQVVRLVTVAISAVVAFIVSIYLYDTFVSWLTSMGTEGILNMTGVTVDEATRNVIISIDTEFLVYVASIPFIVVIAPLSMVLLYGIFAFITWIIHKIVCGALGFTRANNNGLTRFGGFLVEGFAGFRLLLHDAQEHAHAEDAAYCQERLDGENLRVGGGANGSILGDARSHFGGDGIVTKGADKTVSNIGRLAREGMRQTDRTILEIMLSDGC